VRPVAAAADGRADRVVIPAMVWIDTLVLSLVVGLALAVLVLLATVAVDRWRRR
jgi:hypothetical protein